MSTSRRHSRISASKLPRATVCPASHSTGAFVLDAILAVDPSFDESGESAERGTSLHSILALDDLSGPAVRRIAKADGVRVDTRHSHILARPDIVREDALQLWLLAHARDAWIKSFFDLLARKFPNDPVTAIVEVIRDREGIDRIVASDSRFPNLVAGGFNGLADTGIVVRHASGNHSVGILDYKSGRDLVGIVEHPWVAQYGVPPQHGGLALLALDKHKALDKVNLVVASVLHADYIVGGERPLFPSIVKVPKLFSVDAAGFATFAAALDANAGEQLSEAPAYCATKEQCKYCPALLVCGEAHAAILAETRQAFALLSDGRQQVAALGVGKPKKSKAAPMSATRPVESLSIQEKCNAVKVAGTVMSGLKPSTPLANRFRELLREKLPSVIVKAGISIPNVPVSVAEVADTDATLPEMAESINGRINDSFASQLDVSAPDGIEASVTPLTGEGIAGLVARTHDAEAPIVTQVARFALSKVATQAEADYMLAVLDGMGDMAAPLASAVRKERPVFATVITDKEKVAEILAQELQPGDLMRALAHDLIRFALLMGEADSTNAERWSEFAVGTALELHVVSNTNVRSFVLTALDAFEGLISDTGDLNLNLTVRQHLDAIRHSFIHTEVTPYRSSVFFAA